MLVPNHFGRGTSVPYGYGRQSQPNIFYFQKCWVNYEKHSQPNISFLKRNLVGEVIAEGACIPQ